MSLKAILGKSKLLDSITLATTAKQRRHDVQYSKFLHNIPLVKI
jgi:DNA repair exonuclease SbcCD ATPase subunit